MIQHITKNSVFDDLNFDAEEAANLKARAALMNQVIAYIEDKELTQQQAAKLLHVTQPRMNDLKQGKIQLFTADTLIKILNRIN
ncbi:MAG: XRE family transcriptional regulator [Pseudomonadota bacterium]